VQVALAFVGLGIHAACGAEPAASEVAPQAATAMVQDPCPAPLAVPQAIASLGDSALKPGKPDPGFAELLKNPEVQAYVKTQQERALRDWPNLCRYRAANALLTHPPRVVFMGDSITENWVRGDPTLFNQDVIGRGISGQTSPQMLVRFFQDVVDLKPRIVHIMAGTNDVAGNTGPTTEQDFESNIMAMAEIARAHHIRVVLAAIPPASAFPWKPALKPAQTIARLNEWLRTYALQNGFRFVDYYSVLADAQGGFIAALSNDGVHPNQDGYAVMRKLALPSIER
jgi:lysophospholipase L1-like esterase